MLGGLLCYFHWEAMLISYLSKIVISVPFSNMEELSNSDYQVNTLAGSTFFDAFKYGNELWQKIYEEKLAMVDQGGNSIEECQFELGLEKKLIFSFDCETFQ